MGKWPALCCPMFDMRFLIRLSIKCVTMAALVLLLAAGVKYGQRHLLEAQGIPASSAGVEAPHFSSEESDLMSTVLKGVFRLFSGSATRKEVAKELSDKLYASRGDASEWTELGIEIAKPGETPADPKQGNKSANPPPGAGLSAKQHAPAGASSGSHPSSINRAGLLAKVWAGTKPYTVEMTLVPVVFLGMLLVNRMRRRSTKDEFAPQNLALLLPSESEPFQMKHAVHSLKSEDFELLVALIYQRQGYRVSMPAGLSGGRGCNFTLARKSERVLVICKKMGQDHKVPVERVRELQEAAVAAGATRGMYVASCGFTWDARNFGKTNRVTLINARTLDELITAARANPEEDLMKVQDWAPKLMSKVELNPPHCPACEAAMEEVKVSENAVWLCSQRPECRGRRVPRTNYKAVSTAAA